MKARRALAMVISIIMVVCVLVVFFGPRLIAQNPKMDNVISLVTFVAPFICIVIVGALIGVVQGKARAKAANTETVSFTDQQVRAVDTSFSGQESAGEGSEQSSFGKGDPWDKPKGKKPPWEF